MGHLLGPRACIIYTSFEEWSTESCFKTLKRQEVDLTDSQTFAEAEANLGHFIEAVNTAKRLHSSLGYLPPAEFEAASSTALHDKTCPVVRYMGGQSTSHSSPAVLPSPPREISQEERRNTCR